MVRRTRIGGIWVAFARFALVLLLFFVLENDKSVPIGYFGAHRHVPLGVALLLAAVFCVLLVVIPGTARIIQLPMVAHRTGAWTPRRRHRRRRARPVMQRSPLQAHRAR